MKRNLCYKHHCQEFDKLSNAHRHLAADWRTVEPCEMCEAERTDLLAALAPFAVLYHRRFDDLGDDVPLYEHDGVVIRVGDVRRAKDALAGARSEERSEQR